MSCWMIGSVLGLTYLTVHGGSAGQPPVQTAKHDSWFTDYQAAQAAARSTGKPLFVVFRCQP
jgi:hypothetical protein